MKSQLEMTVIMVPSLVITELASCMNNQ